MADTENEETTDKSGNDAADPVIQDGSAGKTSPKGWLRICITTCMYVNFIAVLGIGTTKSAALVDLAYKYKVSLTSIAVLPTVSIVCYLSGTMVGGFLYRHIRTMLIMGITSSFIILSSAVCAIMPNIYMFFIIMVILESNSGILDCVIQPYILNLWKTHKYRDSIMQGLHAVWSLGVASMGAIMRTFLDKNLQQISRNTTSLEPLVNTSTNTNSNDTVNNYQGNVQGGYQTLALIGVLPTLVCYVFYVLERQWYSKATEKMKETESHANNTKNTEAEAVEIDVKQDHSQLPRRHRIVLVIIAVLMRFTDVELFIGSFISSYAFYGLGWSTPDGAVAFSCFFGGHCAGRLLAVFLSAFFKPYAIITCTSLTILSSNIILTFFGHIPIVVYTCAVAYGMGNSCAFPTLYLWLSNFMKITGPVSGVLFIGDLQMFIAPAYAYIIENVMPRYFMYHIYILTIANLIILNIGRILGNRFTKRHCNRTEGESEKLNKLQETEKIEDDGKTGVEGTHELM